MASLTDQTTEILRRFHTVLRKHPDLNERIRDASEEFLEHHGTTWDQVLKFNHLTQLDPVGVTWCQSQFDYFKRVDESMEKQAILANMIGVLDCYARHAGYPQTPPDATSCCYCECDIKTCQKFRQDLEIKLKAGLKKRIIFPPDVIKRFEETTFNFSHLQFEVFSCLVKAFDNNYNDTQIITAKQIRHFLVAHLQHHP
jgi:hypothetical protein